MNRGGFKGVAPLRRAYQRGDIHAAFNLGAALLAVGEHGEAEVVLRAGDTDGHGGCACSLGVVLQIRGGIAQAEAAFDRP